MKRLFYILVLLFAINFGHSLNGAKKSNGHSFCSLNIKRGLKENAVVFNSNNVSSDSSKEKPDTLKKKIVKGIEQTLLFVSNESSFRTIIIENKPGIFSQTAYYPDLFSGNGKRGPPSSICFTPSV